jgi:hypothetical protein
MKKRAGMYMTASLSVIVLLVVLAGLATAFSGGPQFHVTDIVPACAHCHSTTKVEYTPEWPADRSMGELAENKHYKAIESGDRGYKLIPEDRRKALLEVVKWVDANSSVSLSAPTSAKPGQTIEVTVETKGGIGPVVGVFLLDQPLRYQSRPIASDGWYIVGKPTVIGPDGKEQSWWLDKRANEKKNLGFVVVQAKADVENKVVPTAKVTWNLRAPVDPGTYTLTAAFSHGTEEPDEHKSGKLEPAPGGSSGPSGRTHFSDTVTVTVK